MQLTTKGRYAVTAMLDLASNDTGKPITLDIISQRQNISLSYLEQLFAKLRRAELVKSVRGPGGGYLLNILAKDINENIDLRRCSGTTGCHNGRQCISHRLWCEVSGQIRDFLSSKTLQMVIDDQQQNTGIL